MKKMQDNIYLKKCWKILKQIYQKFILLDVQNEKVLEYFEKCEVKMDAFQNKYEPITNLPGYGDIRKMIRKLYICFLVSMLILGSIFQLLADIVQMNGGYRMYMIPLQALKHPKEILVLGVLFYILWGFLNFMQAQSPLIDEERGFEYAPTNEYGSMRPLTGKKYDLCIEEVDVKDAKGPILGYGKKDPTKVCCIRETKPGSRPILSNPHIAACGGSGSGKSYSIARPEIYQAISAGHSYIVTETSGELYQDTSDIARKNGYEVKLLNYIPDSIVYSDSCNYIKQIINGDSSKAVTLATVILENTTENRGFWDDAQKNILTALLLLVDGSKDIDDDKKNLGTVLDYIVEGPVALSARISALPPNHPAKKYGLLFVNAEGKVKESAVFGLGVRLAIFMESNVRNAIKYDEVSLSAPGQKKCAYYVNISDAESSYQVLSALFFNFIFIELGNVARRQEKSLRLPVMVDIILDEFTNIGILNEFDKTVSTVRKYGISIIPIFQDIGQMMNKYPKTYSSILANCALNLYLGGNDSVYTPKFYSALFGTATVVDESETRPVNILLPNQPKIHTKKTLRTKARQIYMEDEILGLDSDHVLIKLERQGPLKLKKFDYHDHPLNRDSNPCSVKEHVPEWKKATMKVSYVEDEDETDSVDTEVVNEQRPKTTVKPITKPITEPNKRNSVPPQKTSTDNKNPRKQVPPKKAPEHIPVPKGTYSKCEDTDDDLMLMDKREFTPQGKDKDFKDF